MLFWELSGIGCSSGSIGVLETLLFDPYILQQICTANMRRFNKLLVVSQQVETAGKGDGGTCSAGGEKFQQPQRAHGAVWPP